MTSFIKGRINSYKGISPGITTAFINTMGTMCTNRCYMCPVRTMDGKNIRMPRSTFDKIISQLKDINFSGELHLYAQNEPFLDPDMFNKIEYAHQKLPHALITFVSNFTALNSPQKIKKLVNAPITYLSCSIYALNNDAYTAICGRDNYALSIKTQIKFIKEYAKNPKYSFAVYLMNSEHNKNDMDFCKHFLFNIMPIARADYYEVFNFFNTNHRPREKNSGYINQCIYDRLQFMNDGDISLCSIDSGGDLSIGSIHDGHISQIVNNEKAVELRKRMLDDKQEDAFCRYCEFGRYESKLLYFLPIPDILRKFLNKKFVSSFKNEHEVKVYSKKEIQGKLPLFNELFKDHEEDKWLSVIEKLREDFYANHKK